MARCRVAAGRFGSCGQLESPAVEQGEHGSSLMCLRLPAGPDRQSRLFRYRPDAQRMQVRAAGRAFSRSEPIGPPQLSQTV